jgi:DNA-binding NtrC family response regulator
MVTGYASLETAVRSLRLGALDYLAKPVSEVDLLKAVERALTRNTLKASPRRAGPTADQTEALECVVGTDPRMLRVLELVSAVAPSRTTVLMSGESGVGKSMIARAIHERSSRASKPFVELSCGSIPETLLESELFGHVKGAFTGAHANKVGRFLAADGGTIFLDEINAASPAMQLKLLRVLQERKFEPVGSSETREVDVRIVLASNQPLEKLVENGSFRQDLYYRINVVKIELPPLRERRGDIPQLAERFLEMSSAEVGKAIAGFTDEAIEALSAYSFPGNVRELQNIVERAAVLTRGQTIGLDDLPPDLVQGRTPLRLTDEEWTPAPLAEALREPERRIILQALDANDWNRQKTAEQLDINRTTLYKKMRSLGIEERMAG